MLSHKMFSKVHYKKIQTFLESSLHNVIRIKQTLQPILIFLSFGPYLCHDCLSYYIFEAKNCKIDFTILFK